jgi:hypothetical protein
VKGKPLNCWIDLYPDTADVVTLKLETEKEVFDFEFLASAVLCDVWNTLTICSCKNMMACERRVRFPQYDCLEDIRNNG